MAAKKNPNNSGINLIKYMQESLYLKLITLLKRKKKRRSKENPNSLVSLKTLYS